MAKKAKLIESSLTTQELLKLQSDITSSMSFDVNIGTDKKPELQTFDKFDEIIGVINNLEIDENNGDHIQEQKEQAGKVLSAFIGSIAAYVDSKVNSDAIYTDTKGNEYPLKAQVASDLLSSFETEIKANIDLQRYAYYESLSDENKEKQGKPAPATVPRTYTQYKSNVVACFKKGIPLHDDNGNVKTIKQWNKDKQEFNKQEKLANHKGKAAIEELKQLVDRLDKAVTDDDLYQPQADAINTVLEVNTRQLTDKINGLLDEAIKERVKMEARIKEDTKQKLAKLKIDTEDAGVIAA